MKGYDMDYMTALNKLDKLATKPRRNNERVVLTDSKGRRFVFLNNGAIKYLYDKPDMAVVNGLSVSGKYGCIGTRTRKQVKAFNKKYNSLDKAETFVQYCVQASK